MKSSGTPRRLAEEFGVVSIAELVDYADKAPVASLASSPTLRVRTTKKGEQMAWIVLSDGTAGLECAMFPSAYQKLNGPTVLREGAFLVGQGRLAREKPPASQDISRGDRAARWARRASRVRSPWRSDSGAATCRHHRR